MAILKPCIMCNETKITNTKNYYEIKMDCVYHSENTLCKECYDMLKNIYNLTKFSEKEYYSTEEQKSMIEAYNKKIRSKVVAKSKTSKVEWFRNESNSLIETADACINTYERYHDILYTVGDIIDVQWNMLPTNRIDYGFSTFSRDDEFLYYMKYGKPLCNNEYLFGIENYNQRAKTSKELMDNVINKSSLVEKIKLENIIYFQEKGDISYSTSVSGGGSKGVSYGRAAIGGVLFGVAGAVVGGMAGNKTEGISSDIVQHDDRFTVIRYKDSDGKTVERRAIYDYYNLFNTIIPEKEYSYVQLNSDFDKSVSVNNPLPVEELKKLKELLDIGVITQEEFEQTKKKLLGI